MRAPCIVSLGGHFTITFPKHLYFLKYYSEILEIRTFWNLNFLFNYSTKSVGSSVNSLPPRTAKTVKKEMKENICLKN